MTTRIKKAEKKYKTEQELKLQEEKWDKKSVYSLILVILSAAIVFTLILVDFRGIFISHSKNWDKTIGRIDSVEKHIGLDQTRAGNIFRTTGYTIEYTYIVDKKEYKAEGILSSQKFAFADYAKNTKGQWKVEVYFEKKNFSKSRLNLDLDSEFYKQIR